LKIVIIKIEEKVEMCNQGAPRVKRPEKIQFSWKDVTPLNYELGIN
jgi:hypothetical protein